MKKLLFLALSIFALLLLGCSGSDTYSGSWKAIGADGAKFEIVFAPKSFTVTDSIGKVETFDYTQNSVNIENGVETYGIKLSDGRAYQVNFPIAKDESVGLIKDQNGMPMFTIGRNEYVAYEDIFKWN